MTFQANNGTRVKHLQWLELKEFIFWEHECPNKILAIQFYFLCKGEHFVLKVAQDTSKLDSDLCH